jgi:murein DD-endopeptidase MepM/ murein hydrolase activator NlpD
MTTPAHVSRRQRARPLGLAAALVLSSVGIAVEEARHAAPVAAAACPAGTYTVVKGDSWSGIAHRHKVTLTALLAENKATATTLIHPGRTLCLPAGAVTPAAFSAPTTAPVPTAPPTAPVTTAPPPAGTVIPLSQFPVQGPCAFGDSWGAPRSGGRLHEGVDIIAKSGLFVYAARDGVLTRRYLDAPGSLSGNGWRLTAADGAYFFYAHLSAFAPGLEVGSSVKAGQIIGFIGMTGSAGVPHLHFEIHPGGGAAINPTPSVRAVDGCKVTTPPAQPGGSLPAPPATTTPPSTVPPPPSAGAASGMWQFASPVKLLDTGTGVLSTSVPTKVTVSGVAGVPVNATSVLVRIVARNVPSNGYLTVHPCEVTAPSTASMVVRPGMLNAGTAMVDVTGGRFCVTSSQPVAARIDVVAASTAGTGVGIEPVVPQRALDTRSSGRLAANGSASMTLKALGVPAGTAAVTATVTVVNPDNGGSVALGPCGGSPWVLAFQKAPVQSFSTVIRINDAGLCASSTVGADLVVDVNGAWRGPQPIRPTAARRALDTRVTGQLGVDALPVTLPGAAGGAAQLTITLIGGSTSGSAVFAWPCASPKPSAAVVATPAKVTTSVNATLAVTGGVVCVAATSPSHVVIDVTAAS